MTSLGVGGAPKRSIDFMCGINTEKWRRGTLDKSDAKRTGKPINYFTFYVNMKKIRIETEGVVTTAVQNVINFLYLLFKKSL